MDQPNNAMDRLTSLPPELLDEIQELVHAEEPHQYLGLVHRVFLPTSRRLFFRTISIPTCQSFDDFWEMVWNNQAVAACIREISIAVEIVVPKQDNPPSSNVLRRLYRQLINVERVTFKGSTALAGALLTPPATGGALSAVQHLRMSLDGDGESQFFEPRSFRSLNRYLRLDALEIVQKRRGWGLKEPYKRYKGQWPSDRSWWLSFTGEILDNPAFSDLLKSFPLVDTLRLRDTGVLNTSTSLSTLFASVRQPSTLTALCVIGKYGRIDNILPSLVIFPNLFSLELGQRTFRTSSLGTLFSLPKLARLVFLRKADISIVDLTPLLDLPSLTTLRLDTVHTPWSDGFNPREHYGWTTSFTFDGLSALIDLAESKGVKVIGLAAGLVRRERDYQERVAKWMKRMEEGATV